MRFSNSPSFNQPFDLDTVQYLGIDKKVKLLFLAPSTGLAAGADPDRFHQFPCIVQVSKPKKEWCYLLNIPEN